MNACISKNEAEQLNLPKYFTGRACKRGHVSERYTKSSVCCACAAENSWSRNHTDPNFIEKRRSQFKRHYARNKATILKKSTEWNRSHPINAMISRAKTRAGRKGLEFDITLDDIIIPATCPVLGIPLKLTGEGKREDHSPSLDRIDSSKGYTKDNVVVISWRANRIKNDATAQELQLIVQYITSSNAHS